MLPICECNIQVVEFTVKKEGPNKGRKFRKCKNNNCKYWEWSDGNNYNPDRFALGSCFRCGRYGCYIEDCKETNDYYGNNIPDDYWKLN